MTTITDLAPARTRDRDDMPPGQVECGTYAGYQRHRRNREPACRPCLDANTDYHAVRRNTQRTLIPLRLLGQLLAAAPDELVAQATRVLGDRTVRRALNAQPEPGTASP